MDSFGLNDRQFGLLIAYVIPGFLVVNGMSFHLPVIAGWLGPTHQPSLGGVLYITLSSVGCGLVVSALRWLVVDTFFHRTGVEQARWGLSELRENLQAFEVFVLYTYRYYQFYANCAVAVFIWFALRMLHTHEFNAESTAFLLGIESVLLAGARDTLGKYYRRTNEILHPPSRLVISSSIGDLPPRPVEPAT